MLGYRISYFKLIAARPEYILRLARFLKIETQDISYPQVLHMVHENLSYPPERFDSPQKKADYESMWENLPQE